MYMYMCVYIYIYSYMYNYIIIGSKGIKGGQLLDVVLCWSLKKFPGLIYLEQMSITKSWPFNHTNLHVAIVFLSALINKRT